MNWQCQEGAGANLAFRSERADCIGANLGQAAHTFKVDFALGG